MIPTNDTVSAEPLLCNYNICSKEMPLPNPIGSNRGVTALNVKEWQPPDARRPSRSCVTAMCVLQEHVTT